MRNTWADDEGAGGEGGNRRDEIKARKLPRKDERYLMANPSLTDRHRKMLVASTKDVMISNSTGGRDDGNGILSTSQRQNI